MGRLTLAFKCFFGILFGSVDVQRAGRILEPSASSDASAPPTHASDVDVRKTVSSSITATVPSASAAPGARAVKPRRSEAIALLSALQREARFVDLVQEPLQQYTDQQIGAAARDVLRDCNAVLQRMFAIVPVIEGSENAMLETPATIPAGRLMVTGKPAGNPPFRGRLVHHGWEASQCQLPEWTGDEQAKNVIAPAEIECQ